MFSAAEMAQLDQLPAHRQLAQFRRAQAAAAKRVRSDLRDAALATVMLPMLYRVDLERENLEALADVLEAEFVAR
jgi:hypothetical protein